MLLGSRISVFRSGRLLWLLFATLNSVACISARPSPDLPALPVPNAPRITDADIAYFANHELMVPVDGIPPEALEDSFNSPRANGRFHRAMDIPAERETPVVAAISGYVHRLSQNASGGITAYLVDDERRYVYYYAHLSRYADQLTNGLKVDQGSVIGYVGTSGNAPPDTPHLHFQVMRLVGEQKDWWNGPPVDVRTFMTKRGTVQQ